MALENTKLNFENEKNKEIDKATLDAVFGKDPNVTTELISNEKNHNGVKPNDNSFVPLLDLERDKQKLPVAESEMDDLDGDPPAPANGAYPGIDDGLLGASDDKPHILEIGDELDDKSEPELRENGVGTDDDGLSPRFGVDDRPMSAVPSSIDVNTYQQKKNLAQGMMDLALLSANANQLRYVLESATNHPYYYPSLVFISLSIIFQIAVGVGLIMNSRYDVNDKAEICKADKINNFTVLGIFLITIVNVFITSFSVATVPVAVQTPGGPIIQQAG